MPKRERNKTAETITDFGDRQLNKQNFSRTVVLPKTALKNCGCDPDGSDVKVNVSLVQKGNERFIKVKPVCDADMAEVPDEKKDEKDE